VYIILLLIRAEIERNTSRQKPLPTTNHLLLSPLGSLGLGTVAIFKIRGASFLFCFFACSAGIERSRVIFECSLQEFTVRGHEMVMGINELRQNIRVLFIYLFLINTQPPKCGRAQIAYHSSYSYRFWPGLQVNRNHRSLFN